MLMFYAALVDSVEGKQRIEYLYLTYRKQMFFVANSILNDTFEAENAVHDAFVGIAVSIEHVPHGSEKEEQLYVLACARHAAYKLIEKNKRHMAEFDITSLDEADIMLDDVTFAQVAASENAEMLNRAIARLPDKYRDVLLMQHVYNLKVKEIAAVFSRKPDTVEKQLARARSRLYKLCIEEGMVLGNEKSADTV